MSIHQGIVPARQPRAQETATRLLDSAEQLLREKGLAGFCIAAVAAHAGRGVGTVYERFTDRDALLLAVFDRYLARGAKANAEILDGLENSGASLASLCTKLADGFVRRFRQDARLLHALRALTAQSGGESLAHRAVNVAQAGLARSRSALLSRRDEIAHPKPEAAVDLVLMMMAGAAELNGSVPAKAAADHEVSRALADAAMAYFAWKSRARTG